MNVKNRCDRNPSGRPKPRTLLIHCSAGPRSPTSPSRRISHHHGLHGQRRQNGRPQDGTHNLLTQLKNAAVHPEDVYVSIVPFSISFGQDNYAESWLRWDLWEAVNGTYSSTKYHKQSSCVSNGKIWTPAAHSTWNDCVTDRDQNYDTKNDAPVSDATLYPTEQYASCSAPLIGLTNDWTKLNEKIDAMTPVGNTNQAIGLQVGWQSLTAAPFTIPTVDTDYKYQTVHYPTDLSVDLGRPDDCHVQYDRHQPDQAARRSVGHRARTRPKQKARLV